MSPTASYFPGPWVAAAGLSMWLIADLDPADSTAAWALVGGAPPVGEVVTALLGAPTRPAASFAVARHEDRVLQVAVRGSAEVVVSVAGRDEVVTAPVDETIDRAFYEFEAVALGMVGAVAAGAAFPLGAAVVPASRIMVTLPAPVADPPVAAPPVPAPPVPAPAVPAPPPVFAPPPTFAPPLVEEHLAGTLTSEPTRPSPSEEGLPSWMLPVARSAPAPPPTPAPPPAPGPAHRPDPAAAPGGANPPWMQPSRDLPPDLAWAEQTDPTPPASTPAWIPAPAPAPTPPPPTAASPLGSGAGGGYVEEEERHTVMRDPGGRGSLRSSAVGQIVLSTGEVITLDGGVILGRAPGDRDRDAPYRIRLASPDGTISRQHVAVRIVGAQVIVEDLQSSNGTWVTPPGGARERLARGERRAIMPGTVVHLDEATWFTFEVLS